MKNVLVTLAILILAWGVRFGWNMITAEPYVEPTAAEWAAEDDTWVQESLSDGTAEPARGWLDQSDTATFEARPQTMNEMIEQMHAAGAENVWMIDIVEFAGKRISDTIAVELPPPGIARDQVFAAEATFWDGEGSEDVGQRYLTLSFD
ncbi:MAG: hypothetical protein ACR2P8_07560 [Myxococcota bacterium]